jgi:hypothetical protein
MSRQNSAKTPRETTVKKHRNKNTMEKKRKTRGFQASRDNAGKMAEFHGLQATKRGVNK